MQGCSQHLPAHDHGAHDEYADMVSEMLEDFLRLSLDTRLYLTRSWFTVCVLQGADAAGAVEDHRGSDEEASGKPKK